MAPPPSGRPDLALPAGTATVVAPAAWRAIDFLSDLHLSAATPRAFAAWSTHLQRTPADAVFILGDLFDAWVGDDMAESGFEARCAHVLADASARRTIGFMVGNRDFLVGEAWLRGLGVRALGDPTIVEAWGARVVATHGDALCLDDVAYQRFRHVVRRPGLQRAFRALPLGWRRGIGSALRARGDRVRAVSMRGTGGGSSRSPASAGLDLDLASCRRWLDSAGATTLVHGHTHAPAAHALGEGRRRLVLSDWSLDDGDAGSHRAEVLRWTAAGFDRVALEPD